MIDTERLDWDSILRRLAGIKALADRGGTLAEAQAASTMMARHLLRYNLTLVDVEHHVTESGRAVTTEEINTTTAGWKRLLLESVARGHLCRSICDARVSTVIGHAHNLIVVREMYLWLLDEINRLCDLAYTDALARDDWGAQYSARSWKNDFRVGAVEAVQFNYQRMLRDAEGEAAAEEWALIPVLAEEVDARVRELFPKTRASMPRISFSGSYSEGETAGSKINLHRQIDGTRESRALRG